MKGLLNYAIRKMLLQHPIFSVIKKAKQPKDEEIIAICHFCKGNELIMVQNALHANTLIKDKKIEKVFYSTEIISDFEYLPFVFLGIEYLFEHCELEDAQKGKEILEKHINKLKKEPSNDTKV